MPRRIGSVIRGVVRRIAALPLLLAGSRLRAEVLQELSQKTLSVCSVGRGAITFYAPTPQLQDRAASLFTKEPDMIRWLDSIGNDAVLWDIGANVGVFSLYAAVQANCRVLAFEPAAANFHVLCRNIQINNLCDRVTAYCLAMSGATEIGHLNLASSEMGAAMSQFGRGGEVSRYWSGTQFLIQGMVGMTIDEFIARFNPPFPTHIKMDVDGLEAAILNGALGTLADGRVRAVMIELSLTDVVERTASVKLLSDFGFRLSGTGERQGTAEECAANHLFERS